MPEEHNQTSAGLPGLVVSDLHLFARRSIGREAMHDLMPRLKDAQVLVLNGDIVDFRWSTLANHRETLLQSMRWLDGLIADLPECRIHYVLGNHDCLAMFKTTLSELATKRPEFHWHEFHLQLGDALFIHGDCTQWRMDQDTLQTYRDRWSRSRRLGWLATASYLASDRIGATRLAHRWHFPQPRTLDRLTHHLDNSIPGWRRTVRHCYFGHTHEPFRAVVRDGVSFHNTGSAIRGMKFEPLHFHVLPAEVNG